MGSNPIAPIYFKTFEEQGKQMSKNSLELYKIGSKVKLADDVHGVIVSINIRSDNYVTYECGWWNGRSYSTQSFASNEIEVTVAEKTRIGFV